MDLLSRGLRAARALICLLLVASTGAMSIGPAFAHRTPAPIAGPAHAAEEKEDSCGRGKATKEFGWKVVDFGISTLKYLIGLFIIPVGFFLVIVGALLQMVEAVAC